MMPYFSFAIAMSVAYLAAIEEMIKALTPAPQKAPKKDVAE